MFTTSEPSKYTVGWWCTISPEFIAAQATVDETRNESEFVSSIYDNGEIQRARARNGSL